MILYLLLRMIFGKYYMKTKLLFGSLLASILLMMLPSISAVEYKAVEKAHEKRLIELLNQEDIVPEKCGMIRKIFRLILKLIFLPIRIIKRFLRILCKVFCLPFKIIDWIIDIITPFRDHCT